MSLEYLWVRRLCLTVTSRSVSQCLSVSCDSDRYYVGLHDFVFVGTCQVQNGYY